MDFAFSSEISSEHKTSEPMEAYSTTTLLALRWFKLAAREGPEENSPVVLRPAEANCPEEVVEEFTIKLKIRNDDWDGVEKEDNGEGKRRGKDT